MAIPFLGSFAASFERRRAYSKAAIPGVTACIDSISYCAFIPVYKRGHTLSRSQQMRMSFMHRLTKLEVRSGD